MTLIEKVKVVFPHWGSKLFLGEDVSGGRWLITGGHTLCSKPFTGVSPFVGGPGCMVANPRVDSDQSPHGLCVVTAETGQLC